MGAWLVEVAEVVELVYELGGVGDRGDLGRRWVIRMWCVLARAFAGGYQCEDGKRGCWVMPLLQKDACLCDGAYAGEMAGKRHRRCFVQRVTAVGCRYCLLVMHTRRE